MNYVGYATLDIDVTQGELITPDALLDGVNTLTLGTKVCVPLAPPGQGSAHFLRWANDELAEAEAAPGDVAGRKAFNCSVHAKCAVECLIDWYLDHFLLDRTLKPHTGLIQKLEALQSNELLGIGVSLFDSVMFRPRNDAMHDYASVRLQDVKHSTQLANVTVRNCIRSVPPGMAPIFYGTIDLLQGRAAIERYAAKDPRQAVYLNVPDPDLDGMWLTSIGPKGEVSVALDRHATGARVLLLTSDGDRGAEVRYCPIGRAFGTERIQKLFQLLERANPKVIHVTERNVHAVVNSLMNHEPTMGKA